MPFAQKINADYRLKYYKGRFFKIHIDGDYDEKAWEECRCGHGFFFYDTPDGTPSFCSSENWCYESMTKSTFNLIVSIINAMESLVWWVPTLDVISSFGKMTTLPAFHGSFWRPDDMDFPLGANAAAAQWEWYHVPMGGSVDLSWDNKWTSKSFQLRKTSGSLKQPFPFKSFANKQGISEWGLLFSARSEDYRKIRLGSRSTSISPRHHFAYTGILAGIIHLHLPGKCLPVIPYVWEALPRTLKNGWGIMSIDREVGMDATNRLDFLSLSLDAKRAIQNFSQVE